MVYCLAKRLVSSGDLFAYVVHSEKVSIVEILDMDACTDEAACDANDND